jgi:hypothetical protein
MRATHSINVCSCFMKCLEEVEETKRRTPTTKKEEPPEKSNDEKAARKKKCIAQVNIRLGCLALPMSPRCQMTPCLTRAGFSVPVPP